MTEGTHKLIEEITRIANVIEAKGITLFEESPALKFNYPDEFTVVVRVWPLVRATHQNPHVKDVDNELEDTAFDHEDLIRYRVVIPRGVSRDEHKKEIIRRLEGLGYRYLNVLRNMDRIHKRVFGFLD